MFADLLKFFVGRVAEGLRYTFTLGAGAKKQKIKTIFELKFKEKENERHTLGGSGLNEVKLD